MLMPPLKPSATSTMLCLVPCSAPYTSVAAKDVAVGDRILVLAEESNPQSGFVAATVTGISMVNDTSYLPALEKPYMVVEGVVTPL